MEIEEEEGGANPQTTSTQLKCQHLSERIGSCKKVKASKMFIYQITLTEGDLHDIGETMRDVTTEALQNFTEEKQIVLGGRPSIDLGVAGVHLSSWYSFV